MYRYMEKPSCGGTYFQGETSGGRGCAVKAIRVGGGEVDLHVTPSADSRIFKGQTINGTEKTHDSCSRNVTW